MAGISRTLFIVVEVLYRILKAYRIFSLLLLLYPGESRWVVLSFFPALSLFPGIFFSWNSSLNNLFLPSPFPASNLHVIAFIFIYLRGEYISWINCETLLDANGGWDHPFLIRNYQTFIHTAIRSQVQFKGVYQPYFYVLFKGWTISPPDVAKLQLPASLIIKLWN